MRHLAVLTVVLTCCTRAEAPPPFRLRIAAVGPLAPLSPQLVSGYSAMVQGLVFEPLAQPSSDGGLRSDVVRDWEQVDPIALRFRLTAGVRFSDGSVPGGADVAEALLDHASVEEDGGWLTAQWKGSGESPEAQLLSSALSRRTQQGLIGTGPFVVVSQDEHHLVLRRRAPSPRQVGEVELLSFPTQREAFAAVLLGEVNMLLMPDDGQLELLSGVERLRVIRGPGIHSVGALFNATRLAAADRKQLALTLRSDLVANSYGPLCGGEVTAGAGASVPSGGPIEILVINSPPGLARTAIALRRALGPRGGKVSTVTIAEAQKRTAARDFSLLVATWQTWPPDFATSAWYSGGDRNLTGYSNPRVDAALQRSDYALARAELAADPPAAYFCRLDRTAVVDARLFDAQLGEYDMLESVASWRVAR